MTTTVPTNIEFDALASRVSALEVTGTDGSGYVTLKAYNSGSSSEKVTSLTLDPTSPYDDYRAVIFSVPIDNILASDIITFDASFVITSDVSYLTRTVIEIFLADSPTATTGIELAEGYTKNMDNVVGHHEKFSISGNWTADANYSGKYINVIGWATASSAPTSPLATVTVEQDYGRLSFEHLRKASLLTSAYQVWLDDGNTGLESDFLESLRGPAGSTSVGTGGVTASGNVYPMTTTYQLLNFGGTDPVLTLPSAAGDKFIIFCRVQYNYNAATFTATRNVTTRLHRSNNTPDDVSGGAVIHKTDVITTKTYTFQDFTLFVPYVAVGTNDILELWGYVSTAPSAGSLDCVAAQITYLKL